MNASTKATLLGLGAVLLWSGIVSLIKEVTQAFGAIGGSALMYSVAVLFLLLSLGWVPLKKFPRNYLWIGGLLMMGYELCLSLSIGYSQNNLQAIEIGMVNYLWPSFTLLATVIFHTKKANWLIVPGVLLAIVGIVWVLAGDNDFSFSQLMVHVQQNPFSYGLAFLGACLWAAYCVVTIKYAKGVNGIVLFFMLVAISLWIQYLFFAEASAFVFTGRSLLFLVLAAIAMGFGYAAWNVAIQKGNVTVLTVASYFIPVFSSALSSLLLSTALGWSFWKGAMLVCVGSLLCWLSTRY